MFAIIPATAKQETKRNPASCSIRHIGKTVWVFQPELLKQYVTNAGLLALEWSGLRVAHDADYRLAAELAAAERTGLIQLEHQLGTAADTRGMGQMLHFIAQKHG